MSDHLDDPLLKHLREQAALAHPALKERVLNDEYNGCEIFHDDENRLYWLKDGVVNLTPEDIAERNRRRSRLRAKVRQERVRAGGPKPSADKIAHLRKIQGDYCVYCGAALKGKGHIDHIRPLSRGGTNNIKNLQILCLFCNVLKSDSLPNRLYQPLNLTRKYNDTQAAYWGRRQDWLDVYKDNYKANVHLRKRIIVAASKLTKAE